MKKFPIENIFFGESNLYISGGEAAIHISIKPFFMVDYDGFNELVETCIDINGVYLENGDCNYEALEGAEFIFPVNPECGYLDVSIYLCDAHNPIDITRITFGKIVDGKIKATIKSLWMMEFERTGFENFKYDFEIYLKLT